MQDLHGRDALDPCVQTAVLNSIRQMPFRDLVAEIEGEEAAATLEQPAFAATPVMPSGSIHMTASGKDNFPLSGFSESAGKVPILCPSSKQK